MQNTPHIAPELGYAKARKPAPNMVFTIWLFLALSVGHLNGQRMDTIFRRPLDIPVLLSGTFAELRSGHFHSGIDYRTQGETKMSAT